MCNYLFRYVIFILKQKNTCVDGLDNSEWFKVVDMSSVRSSSRLHIRKNSSKSEYRTIWGIFLENRSSLLFCGVTQSEIVIVNYFGFIGSLIAINCLQLDSRFVGKSI